ncbi:MAG: tRNA epoxyqueuosine(34) reductase QueG [Candidatus Acidiferrales bacterium]
MKVMTPAERTAWICDRARSMGFDLCGVADPSALAELAHLHEWLERGYAGEMKYLHDARRTDPKLALVGVRSLIVVALNYNSAQRHSTDFTTARGDDSPHGWISRYAWGDDYHDVIGRKLEALSAAMRGQFAEPFEARPYVDTGPIIERVAAKYAGLGWLAKNTCLINQQLGSWLFLGVIVTTLELAPSVAQNQLPPPDSCGTCTACLDACPTHAFPAPYVLDARRCISYLTIELRGSVPQNLREDVGQAVFGCDICQDVCPWNRKASITTAPEFAPRTFETTLKASIRSEPMEEKELLAQNDASIRSLLMPELEWIAGLSQEEFSAAFRSSAVKRTKWRGLIRNACVALGNAQLPCESSARKRVVGLLEFLAQSEDDLIAEHAQWALDRVEGHHST